MANGELVTRAILERDKYNGIRAAARANGVTHGMIAGAIHGKNSPTLRRLWKVPKHPKRTRLMVSCSQETIDKFDAQRGEQSRREYLATLLDLAEGIGEVM